LTGEALRGKPNNEAATDGASYFNVICSIMDQLTLFGLFAVTAMLVCYALENHSHWFVLGFAMACALGSAYGFIQGAWPFGIVEAIWALVALRRWQTRQLLVARSGTG
jgi:hypothetical protein